MDNALEAARTHFLQGVQHFEAGRLEQARSDFEASLALAPGRPSVLGNLGVTLFHLQRVDDAFPLLQAATAADPGFTDAWACLGLIHEMRGQWQAAANAFASVPAKAPVRFRQGQCLMRLGRSAEALQAFDQALAMAPDFADAWSARGGLLRELMRLDEAAACFEKALACGGDPELNGYYLASVKGGAEPPLPPRRYVEALFDDYAPEFQDHVVTQLRYQGYQRLLEPLAASGRRYRRAIDLGCGTGLCAPLLRQMSDAVDGVDISQAMLEQAGRLGIYRHLAHDDIAAFLDKEKEAADLIVAADVFIYVGDLSRIFPAVRRLLTPGGCFAFTVEESKAGNDLQLQPSLRYAHSEAYIRQLAQ
ncbi:Predicted methyltransferase, contains TPR repeat [Noviherbaspirillum humi]|uniref:Predicted methyltransferase, contains TPR repeat n=1 Tax=Noviherbaspirillum humi TaxID=1688639 RepID=A0A239LWG4_9BURK|nr:tetratricopeptide repeat protein [Noviherbaspirillum humi]SNT34866.1 Predicted methyltransferase, contains TPR repeat [Noviherbaspirillum humi]